ncbi:MAG: ABC transporter permease [Fusobacteriota bacterium]
MGAQEISWISLIFSLFLLIIPVILSKVYKLNIIKETFISVARMFLQLSLVGIFLEVVFDMNNPFLNILWLITMVAVASSSVISKSNLKFKIFFIPVFGSIIITLIFMLSYFNLVIIKVENLLEAKYIISIGGMLLGNFLKGNIIGMNNFYKAIQENEEKYLFSLGLGASRDEAIKPFIRDALIASINPTLVSIATIGLVALPGMMTGQILGGSSPLLAIKYQIAIMIAIYVTRITSVYLVLKFTINRSFNEYGVLKNKIWR